jgi:hypothetical protein
LVSEQWVKNLCENNRMEEAMENSKNSINHKRINSREDYIPFSKMHKAIKQFEGFSRSK